MRRLRPMGIADILDEAVDLYKSNFILLVGIAAIIYVPYSLLQGIMSAPVQGSVDAEQQMHVLLGGFGFLMLAGLFITPVVTVALTFAISDRYLSRDTSIRACYGRVFRGGVFWRLLAALLLKALVWTGAVAAMAIPIALVGAAIESLSDVLAAVLIAALIVGGAVAAAVVWVKLALVEPALIIEVRGARDAVSRSWSLIKGNVTKAFWLLVIVFLIVAVIAAVVTGPTQTIISINTQAGRHVSDWIVALNMVLAILVNVMLTPFASIVSILLYYDIRIRREGFDLQVLAEELGAKARDFAAREAPSISEEQLPPSEERQ